MAESHITRKRTQEDLEASSQVKQHPPASRCNHSNKRSKYDVDGIFYIDIFIVYFSHVFKFNRFRYI